MTLGKRFYMEGDINHYPYNLDFVIKNDITMNHANHGNSVQ